MAYTHRIKNGIRIELTAEEISELENQDTIFENQKLDRALENLRQIRNSLLKKTDWMANSDITMSEAMTTYRQELRDITNDLGLELSVAKGNTVVVSLASV